MVQQPRMRGPASVQHEDRSKPGLHRLPSKKITHAPLGGDCERVAPLVVGIVNGGHRHGATFSTYPVRVHRLTWRNNADGREARGVEVTTVQLPPGLHGTLFQVVPKAHHYRRIARHGEHGTFSITAG